MTICTPLIVFSLRRLKRQKQKHHYSLCRLVKSRKVCKLNFPCWNNLSCFNKWSNTDVLTSRHEVKYDKRHFTSILIILFFFLKILVLVGSVARILGDPGAVRGEERVKATGKNLAKKCWRGKSEEPLKTESLCARPKQL